jgi:exodeoxyribonuclease-3/AP endonuclease-1
MPSAFGQSLKPNATEVTLDEESTPNSDAKKRGGTREPDATPAKKLRVNAEDTKESGKILDDAVPGSNDLGISVSRLDLAAREEADLEADTKVPKEAAGQASKADASAKGKAKAKAGRRKKSDSNATDADGTASTPQDAGASKTKKAKKEGPYTKHKEDAKIPEPHIERRSIPDGATSLKAVAWNIGGLRSFVKNRPDALATLVREERPDILGLIEHKLQEGAADTESTMEGILEKLPEYETAALHCSTAKKGYSGTLILKRKDGPKLVSVTPLDLPSAKDEGRLIIVEFEALFLVLAYVPNSGDGLKRLEERIEHWDVQLREKLKTMGETKPTVLLGDLNVAHRDEDIWNVEAPHIPKAAGTTPQERSSFSALLDAGFVDGFSHFHPEALGAFTYWSVRAFNRPKNRGLRLDYAVVSRSLLPPSAPSESKETSSEEAQSSIRGPALVDVFHLPEMCTGDHCPVGAVLTV